MEHTYDTSHPEHLAVVWAVLLLQPYLEGTHFIKPTDHDVLTWILSLADATRKLAQWRLRLSEMEFDVAHCARIEHQSVDERSRLSTTGKDCTPIDDALPVMGVFASPKEHGKVGTEITDVMDDYDDNGLCFFFPGLWASCNKVNAKPKMNTKKIHLR